MLRQKKAPVSLRFLLNGRQYTVPSIRACTFTQDEISAFDAKDNKIPLVMDITAVGPCNLRCIYCYTEHSTTQGGFDSFGMQPLSLQEQIEVIRQYGKLGGRTMVLCSLGETIINPRTFLLLAEAAHSVGVSVIAFTNATRITLPIAKRLHELGVNLILKLESLDPTCNEAIVGSCGIYQYVEFAGVHIPRQIADVIGAYWSDRDMLALQSITTRINQSELLDIRAWAFDRIGISHLVKHLYMYGSALQNQDMLELSPEQKREIDARIAAFDAEYGFVYNPTNAPVVIFDFRRFLNECLNPQGYPARLFTNPFGGVFSVSDAMAVRLDGRKPPVIGMRDEKGRIDVRRFFEEVYEFVSSLSV